MARGQDRVSVSKVGAATCLRMCFCCVLSVRAGIAAWRGDCLSVRMCPVCTCGICEWCVDLCL